MAKLCSIIFLTSSLLACQKDSPGPLQNFTLVAKQPTALPIDGNVQATLTELSDSRCPSDVMCIWGGTIAATVAFADGSTTQTVRLGYQKNYGVDSAAVVLAGHSYWLRLLDAQPYPSTTNITSPRTVFLRLRPR